MRSRRHRGIVIVFALILVFLVALIGRALVSMGPLSMALSDSDLVKAKARRAAESGTEYIIARLREDPDWRASERIVVNTQNMYVREWAGNVVGLITGADGTISQFRVRFNYQDTGADGTYDDRVDDLEGADRYTFPGYDWLIDHPYVSVNNIKGKSPVICPRAVKDGLPGPLAVFTRDNWPVVDPTVGVEVPPRAAMVFVQGRAGRGLQRHTSAAANAPPDGPIETYVAENLLEMVVIRPLGEASIMAGGDLDLKIGPDRVVNVVSADRGVPQLRTKASLTVENQLGDVGEINMNGGRVGRDEDGSPGLSATFVGNEPTLSNEFVGDTRDFFNLKWEEVLKAGTDPTGGTTGAGENLQIPGGTYIVFGPDADHARPYVKYYDMGFADFQTHIANPTSWPVPDTDDGGIVLSSNFEEVRAPANVAAFPTGLSVTSRTYNDYGWGTTIGISEDLGVVTSTGGVNEFNLLPVNGGQMNTSDTDHGINHPSGNTYNSHRVMITPSDAIVSVPGDSLMVGRLNATNTTITCEGDFTMNSPSSSTTANGRFEETQVDEETGEEETVWRDGVVHVKRGVRVNLYVKGDIDYSTYNAQNDHYYGLDWTGLIYTWGDFKATMYEADAGRDHGNRFNLNGALVAYGADPATEQPGSEDGKGKVEIAAYGVNLRWDQAKMSEMMDIGLVSFDLRRKLYHGHKRRVQQ